MRKDILEFVAKLQASSTVQIHKVEIQLKLYENFCLVSLQMY